MASTFDIDGKVVREPSVEDIERGFASIDAGAPRSISVIELRRGENTLWAFGHPKEGYTLELETIDASGTETSKVTSPAKLIQHDEVVRLFCDFARGDDSWQNKYEWQPGLRKLSTAQMFRGLALLVVIGIVLIFLVKFAQKHF